ncbi:MAG: DUF3592 domain-containing protein [Anaerolineales bacterium]
MGFIIFIIGAFILIGGLLELFRAISSKTWSATQGVITHVGHYSTRKSSGVPVFFYDYTVNGEKYTGSRIVFGGGLLGVIHYKFIQSEMQQYKEGQTVTVYYKESSPKNSVLQPGLKWQTYVQAGVGILLVVLGMFGNL